MSGERPLGSQHRRALSVAPSELGDRVAIAVECDARTRFPDPTSRAGSVGDRVEGRVGHAETPTATESRDRRNGCGSTTAYEPDTIGWASPW